MEIHKCPKGFCVPNGYVVKQFRDLGAIFWGVFCFSSITPSLSRMWFCPYCGQKLDNEQKPSA